MTPAPAASIVGRERPANRLAVIVSHPIQYLVPLYRRLARRRDLELKVFFTWHAGDKPVEDRGFATRVAWDIPLTDGYDFETVANVSGDPGTHGFFGLRNPSLIRRIAAWRPDIVHVTGWAWLSHLAAMQVLHRRLPVLFRGDSHLLDPRPAGPRWWLKRQVLGRVFSWPAGFLVVGSNNRAYYERFGVESGRLFACPHSIDVARFAEPAAMLEQDAASWRRQLGIAPGRKVVIFAGKFERKKRPVDLMRAVQRLGDRDVVLILVGGGEMQQQIDAIAAADPDRFRVLPFQNQSRMPVVYRLGQLFVLPSGDGESWGLAVNEALACGRPVLVSDRVGCAADLVDPTCGRVFGWSRAAELEKTMDELLEDPDKLRDMGRNAADRAWSFDVAATEVALVAAIDRLCAAKMGRAQ